MDARPPSNDHTDPPSDPSKGRKRSLSVSFGQCESPSASVVHNVGKANTTWVKMDACQLPNVSVTSNVQTSTDFNVPPSDSWKDRKQTLSASFTMRDSSLTSVFRSLGEGEDISAHMTHDKITLGMISLNAFVTPVCGILSAIPLFEEAQEKISLTEMFQRRLEEIKPLNSGLYLSMIMFGWAGLVTLYACASTCRRNEAGGLLYRHPGYMPRIVYASLTIVPVMGFVWAGLLAHRQLAWALVTVVCSHIISIVTLVESLRHFHRKEKRYPHAVSDREKWIFRFLVINCGAFVAARLGLYVLKTLVLLLRKEVGEKNHDLISYVFYGLLGAKIVVVGVIELVQFLDWSVYLYGHVLAWTAFSLVISVLSIQEGVSTSLKVLPCVLTALAVVLFAIKITKTVKYFADNKVSRTVAPSR